MNFFSLVTKRHSVREYSSADVSRDMIDKILSATKTAPSAGGLKAYDVKVVTDSEQREALGKLSPRSEFVAQAPVVFVFCARVDISEQKYGKRGRKLYSVQDATIACSYAQLAATELGLGSCWVGAFDENKVRELFQLKDDSVPIILLPVGYAA